MFRAATFFKERAQVDRMSSSFGFDKFDKKKVLTQGPLISFYERSTTSYGLPQQMEFHFITEQTATTEVD